MRGYGRDLLRQLAHFSLEDGLSDQGYWHLVTVALLEPQRMLDLLDRTKSTQTGHQEVSDG